MYRSRSRPTLADRRDGPLCPRRVPATCKVIGANGHPACRRHAGLKIVLPSPGRPAGLACQGLLLIREGWAHSGRDRNTRLAGPLSLQNYGTHVRIAVSWGAFWHISREYIRRSLNNDMPPLKIVMGAGESRNFDINAPQAGVAVKDTLEPGRREDDRNEHMAAKTCRRKCLCVAVTPWTLVSEHVCRDEDGKLALECRLMITPCLPCAYCTWPWLHHR